MINEELRSLIKKTFEVGQKLHSANPFEYEEPISEEHITTELLKDFIEENERILQDEMKIEPITLRNTTVRRLKILMSDTELDADTIIRVALTHGINDLLKSSKIKRDNN